MAPERSKESTDRPAGIERQKAVEAAKAHPAEVAKAVKADPKSEGLFSRIIDGAQKGIKEGAASAWKGTKAVFEGTGEFIGVGAAKLIHEGGDSFVSYAAEKTEGIRKVINVAGEAIAITAFEAVHGDRSVIAGAVEYWKGQGIEFGKLPAEKQAELITNFATQAAIGIVGSKGLGAVSKTAVAAQRVEMGTSVAAKAGEAVINKGARLGAMAAWIDAKAVAANDEVFAAKRARKVAGGAAVPDDADRRVHIRPGTEEHAKIRREAAQAGVDMPDAKPRKTPDAPKAGDVPKPSGDVVDIARAAERKLERAKTVAREALESWEPVFVKRSNGEIAVGRVVRIEESGKVAVEFPGKNGESLVKGVDPKEFARLNDPDARLAPEITAKELRTRERMAKSAERSGKSVTENAREVYANAAKDPATRVADAARELGLDRSLSDREAAALLKAHAVKGQGEQAFEFWTKSLGQKMKILQEEGGFTKDQAKDLVRKGYAWEVPMDSRAVKEIATSGNYAKQAEFLATASVDDIRTAVNHGLIDRAADAFEPEFLNALERVASAAKGPGGAGVEASLRKIASELPASVPPEQKKLLDSIIDRATASAAPSVSETLKTAASPSALRELAKTAPAAVMENLPALRTALLRMATHPESQMECLKVLEGLAESAADNAKVLAMMAIEATDPKLWQTSKLFSKPLGLSAGGTEFKEMFGQMAKSDPEKLARIASGEFTSWNFQLRGLEKAAVEMKPFDASKFQDAFAQAPDIERLAVMLGEHSDTRLLDAATIAGRVGPENLDRFFHFGFDRLRAQAANDPSFAEKLKRVTEHYGRDEFGFLKKAA